MNTLFTTRSRPKVMYVKFVRTSAGTYTAIGASFLSSKNQHVCSIKRLNKRVVVSEIKNAVINGKLIVD